MVSGRPLCLPILIGTSFMARGFQDCRSRWFRDDRSASRFLSGPPLWLEVFKTAASDGFGTTALSPDSYRDLLYGWKFSRPLLPMVSGRPFYFLKMICKLSLHSHFYNCFD